MLETVPNFIVAGASKAGTEWLRLALREHPDIYMPPGGHTLDFFSRNYDQGLDWYRRQFEGRGDETAVGEKSSSYIIADDAPPRIAGYNPDVKLIFVLRNPVDRAYSHYCMWLRGGLVSDDVDRELDGHSQLVREGQYHSHLTRFLEHFDREQMHVSLYDDLRADAGTFLSGVFSFLGVDDAFRPSVLEQRYHATKSRPRVQWLYAGAVKTMRAIRRSSRLGDRIVESLRRRGYVDVFHTLNEGKPFPKLSDAARARLADFYRDDVEAMSGLLGRDLSHWLSEQPAPTLSTPEDLAD